MIVWVPTPAMAGLKLPALTPVPEYVPPAGSPPVKVKAAEFTQTVVKELNVTVGVELTVRVDVAALVQELPSV